MFISKVSAGETPPSCRRFILNMSLRLRCQFVKAASARAHLPRPHPLLTSINLWDPNVIKTLEAVLLFIYLFFWFSCVVCDISQTIGSSGASKRLSFMRSVQSFPQFKGIDHSKCKFLRLWLHSLIYITTLGFHRGKKFQPVDAFCGQGPKP